MGTTSVRFGHPRWNRWERWLIGLALMAIAAWGWIGVDRSVVDELSSSLTMHERRAFAELGRETQPRGTGAALSIAPPDANEIPAAAELAARGAAVFEANGCYACHSVDGTAKIGPSLLGLWGTDQAMNDGSVATMDEAYFRQSVLEPQARIVAGFEDAAMPTYEGLVTDEDLEALAAYVRSLR